MRIDISDLGNIESNYQGFTEDYDSSLNERTEDIEEIDMYELFKELNPENENT